MPAPSHTRNRAWLLVAVLLVIALGLASRRFPAFVPDFLGKYPGDALWALMVFFGWAFIMPHASTARLGLLALITSFTVEFLQLYQASWINAIRSTTPGHLVLGSTFAWGDLTAYCAGVVSGIALDRLLPGARSDSVR